MSTWCILGVYRVSWSPCNNCPAGAKEKKMQNLTYKNLVYNRDAVGTVLLGGAVGGVVSPSLVAVAIGVAFALSVVLLLKKTG